MEYTFRIDEKLQDLIDTSITAEDKQTTYGIVVNKFIRQYYSEDRVEAILNNYLDTPSDEKHMQEFRILQECRKQAKIYAKELLKIE